MTEHHWVSLLTCGHYFGLTASWNSIIETGRPSRPIEAFCRDCDKLVTIEKFAKVEEPDPDGPYDDPMRQPGFSDDESVHMIRCESKNPQGDQCNRYSGHKDNHESTRGQSPMVVPPITWAE